MKTNPQQAKNTRKQESNTLKRMTPQSDELKHLAHACRRLKVSGTCARCIP